MEQLKAGSHKKVGLGIAVLGHLAYILQVFFSLVHSFSPETSAPGSPGNYLDYLLASTCKILKVVQNLVHTQLTSEAGENGAIQEHDTFRNCEANAISRLMVSMKAVEKYCGVRPWLSVLINFELIFLRILWIIFVILYDRMSTCFLQDLLWHSDTLKCFGPSSVHLAFVAPRLIVKAVKRRMSPGTSSVRSRVVPLLCHRTCFEPASHQHQSNETPASLQNISRYGRLEFQRWQLWYVAFCLGTYTVIEFSGSILRMYANERKCMRRVK